MNKLNRPSEIPIRKWACHKLECFADYIDAYARSLGGTQCYYLEPYAGHGRYICLGTDCCIDGSPLRALKRGFTRYIFIVKDRQDAENLEQLTSANSASSVMIINGNCNDKKLTRQLLDLIPRSASSFAFIDPPGYRRLHWATIKQLATHGVDWKGNKMELLIAFPLEMALLRNLMRPECRASITRLYGNQRWQEIKQERLDGTLQLDDLRHRLVELFKDGLKGLGYSYVQDFKPTWFSRQPFYHLILASDHNHGKILQDAWGKPRYLPCELLYTKEPDR
jgi:three-Cys-motif partner protein